MAGVKVRAGEANQSRSLGKVAFTCPSCAQREGAYATVQWRVRRLAGIPLVSGLVRATYRCAVCDRETIDKAPAGTTPPFMHRYGVFVVIAIVLAAGAIALKLSRPEPAPRVSDATQRELDALRTRVSKAGLVEVTADIDCKKVLDAAVKQAVPDFWNAQPFAPIEPIIANAIPVLVDDRKDVTPAFLATRACKHPPLNAPFLFVAAGDDEPKRLAELTPKVELYEAEIAKLGAPERFVVIEAECVEESCNARAALITRDGKLLALTPKVSTKKLGPAIEEWAKRPI